MCSQFRSQSTGSCTGESKATSRMQENTGCLLNLSYFTFMDNALVTVPFRNETTSVPKPSCFLFSSQEAVL